MKSIIFFCLGVFLGILAIDFAITAVLCLVTFSLGGGISSGIFTLFFGFLAFKCFEKM